MLATCAALAVLVALLVAASHDPRHAHGEDDAPCSVCVLGDRLADGDAVTLVPGQRLTSETARVGASRVDVATPRPRPLPPARAPPLLAEA